MAYKDLQAFMKALEKKEQLDVVETCVDSVLEITEIADRVSKKNGRALLFKNVKHSPYPVLINAVGSYERLHMAFEVEDLDDIGNEIGELVNMGNYLGIISQIKSIPRLTRMLHVFPKKVKRAICQEVVEEPDLDQLPILKCWPEDGGRYITLPLVITKDPETGQQNMGMYRLQVYDSKTTGMHWHLHKDGREIYKKYRDLGLKKMPVSVALGCDPAIMYAATAPLPKMVDEMMFAGFLRKDAVNIVKCVTNDLYVPANAEFILEGYVDLEEMRLEGPFGDHTGYYSLADIYPVFHIEKITRRREPVYPTTIVGKPPMEDCYLAKATERFFLPLIKLMVPEIVDYNFPLEGVFHNCVIVSIKKSYPKHAQKVMSAMWGLGQMMYTKMIVVVDEQVDPHDLSTVAWKVFNNIDPHRDLVINEGPLDALDHSSNTALYGYRLGIDATKKLKSEGHQREWPNDIEMSQDIKKMVDEKWASYGIHLS
ncbi:menaquinone biosynthesis decarboxylase [Vallitalea pronyensis]|uniref:Phenolic acid decarboxylase n=1 Tax=Vallitalea pronyensis TaxID=1348613 RepID=A0A8J8MHH2_9FIRM|nr:menaquinone biosynthesis decarboxylase [Vallitalea pronyensis]QUI21720.1 menaquinone biosynthesis decarboxylase [Vallitalea pronyensis]